jgi:hypothetical protein
LFLDLPPATAGTGRAPFYGFSPVYSIGRFKRQVSGNIGLKEVIAISPDFNFIGPNRATRDFHHHLLRQLLRVVSRRPAADHQATIPEIQPQFTNASAQAAGQMGFDPS